MSEGRELSNRLLASEVKAELLVLFHKNPGLIDTTEGVARRVGRVAKSIEEDVKDFVDLGILRKKRIGKFEVLALDRARDREIQDMVADYIKGLKRS